MITVTVNMKQLRVQIQCSSSYRDLGRQAWEKKSLCYEPWLPLPRADAVKKKLCRDLIPTANLYLAHHVNVVKGPAPAVICKVAQLLLGPTYMVGANDVLPPPSL